MITFWRHLWCFLLVCTVVVLRIVSINSDIFFIHHIEWGVVAVVIALQAHRPLFWWLIVCYPLMLSWYSVFSFNMYSSVFAITAAALWLIHVYVLKEQHLFVRIILVEIATVIWSVGVFVLSLVFERSMSIPGVASSFSVFIASLATCLLMHPVLIISWTGVNAFLRKRL